jgi:uncharacterized protein DUF5675
MSHTAELELRRHWYTGRSVVGELRLDGADFGFCLEPSMGNVTHPCIPAGRYRVTRYESPRFGRTVLLLHDVPGREAIEIHVGNFPRDTEGCLLVGLGRLDDMVTHSGPALDSLLTKLDGVEEIYIAIIDDAWVTAA